MTAVPHAVIVMSGIEWLVQRPGSGSLVACQGSDTPLNPKHPVSKRTIGRHHGRGMHERAEGRRWLSVILPPGLALKLLLDLQGQGVFTKLHTLSHESSLRPGLPAFYGRLSFELNET